jgi:hypothetical protein
MLDSDVWIGSVKSGVATVVDSDIGLNRLPCTGNIGVCPDTTRGGTNDITDVSGYELDGTTYLQYSRRLKTNDPMDVAIQLGVSNAVILAFGSSDDLGYHDNNRIVLEIDFAQAGYTVNVCRSLSLNFVRSCLTTTTNRFD